MAASLVNKLIARFAGDLVHSLAPDSLAISFEGAAIRVRASNVALKSSLLDGLDVPLCVRGAVLGHLALTLPLNGDPIPLELADLHGAGRARRGLFSGMASFFFFFFLFLSFFVWLGFLFLVDTPRWSWRCGKRE